MSTPEDMSSWSSTPTYGTMESKPAAFGDKTDKQLSQVVVDETASSTSDERKNPFSDPKVAEHYRNLYEKVQYECRREFDPELEWDQKEEKRIVRKLDLRVCTWACIMFFALQVDRGNLGQAVSADMLDDLGMTTNDFNLGNTIFRVSFLLAELPSQLISRRLGADRWIPMQMCAWSIVAAAQAALNGKTSFYVCRVLIGMLEGGFIPDLVLWLSYFYTSSELPIRLSFFWTGLNVTTIITSLLAFGLLHMDGIHGMNGWRWLFLVEGIITLAVGVASFFLMPASAVSTKAWFRPNGWFTDREVGIVVNRVLRDDPSKGDMHNRQGITPGRLWRALSDYDLWPIYAIGLVVFMPVVPPSTYLTLTLRNLGFSTFNTNLLAIPATVVGCCTLLGLTWFSEKVKERSFVALIQPIWALPCLLALRFWPGVYIDAWGTYALISVLLAYPYCHAIAVGWASRNSGSVRTRSVSAAAYNMMVQLGNVVDSNFYRKDDAPLYRRGNTILLVLDFVAMGLFLFAKWYYTWRNRRRQAKWNAMTADEKKYYLDHTTDQGNKRLDFRFAH